jgi:Chitobiase/beta-hexosaminidase C-terminal domain/PASTA domain/Galactose oxidase, central domain
LGVDYDTDFHDITSGGNTLGTTVGYDLSTGWGSPNGSALIDALAGAPSTTFCISASPNSVSVAQGASGTSTITSAIAGGFDASVALSATGQPTGVTPSFNPTSIAAPGSGNSTLTLTVASTTATGMYPITVTGTSGSLTRSTTVTLTVIAAGLAAVPNVVGNSQAAATTAITGAGLVVGTVTMASSSTVPSGDVISESPSAGTVVNSGSAVDIVVSSGSGQPAAAATPVFSPVAGTYSSAQSVTITDATNDAIIYYTTNGTTPTTSSPQYSGAIVVSGTEMLEAIAIASGFSESALATALYAIHTPGSDEWAWISGSNAVGSVGVYGTLGTPAAGNTPGDRDSASAWTDSSGHLWLFGGEGTDANQNYGYFNDLWEFSPSTSEWAWMGGSSEVPGYGEGQPGVYGTLGVPAAGNIPGGRYGATTWTDSTGHSWLLGGEGTDAGGNTGFFSDLWEFNPSTAYWTWIGGSGTIGTAGGQPGVYGTLGTPAAGNIPGARQYGASWADSKGNLWLFGGDGMDVNGVQGELGDLWEFSPSTSQWTWMGGSDIDYCSNFEAQCAYGVYGTQGTPAAGNIPSGRYSADSWTDSSGNFWLFAGLGLDVHGNIGPLNDLWEFNPSTNEWAWMGGSNTFEQSGAYGTMGVPGAGNIPGSRDGASRWTDNSGNLWVFGGEGDDGSFGFGYLNDLWEFIPSTNEWAWMGGSSTVGSNEGQPGVYGALGTPAAGNIPGGRQNASAWTDSNGNFSLFGGFGVDASGNLGFLNDLWNFQLAGSGTTGPTPAATPTFGLASGTYSTAQIVTISDATAGAAIYYTTNGNPPTTSSTLYNGAINVSATETIEAIAVASGYANSAVASATYTIQVSVPIQVGVPNVVGDTQAAATAAITGARLVVGTVTTASSPTVASGDVISESPSAGTSANPGAAVNLVVSTGPALITPAVAVTPSQTSITTTQSTMVTVTVSGGSGNPTPTGSVTLSGGSYTSAATTLTSGSAMIVIPAGTLSAGSYTFQGSYMPDSNSSSIYKSASGTASSLVNVSLTTPSITWTPASTIIYGSAGSNVLNASANTSGSFTYSATPTAGGSPINISSGTAALAIGGYNIAANFTPANTSLYSSAQSTATLFVSGESVWIVNGAGGLSELAGNGYGVTSSADPGANFSVAIDSSGNVWTVGSGSTLLEETSQAGASLTTISSGTGGLDSPTAIAVDGNGQLWITNGDNSVSLFSNAGTALSPSTGFTGATLSTPSGIAVDLSGSVWITNKGSNSVTQILGAAAPAAPLSTAAANKTTGAKP